MQRRGSRVPWVITALSAVTALTLAGAAAMIGADDSQHKAVALADARPEPPVSADPLPDESDADEQTADTGPVADVSDYTLAKLTPLDVWEVIPELPVDDEPFAPTTGLLAQPLAAGAPVFAAPGEEPIAYLPRDQRYGGTIVPVVEQHAHWVKVLLPGRQGVPPEGDAAQTAGWLRAADVDLTRNDSYVEVHLADHTIDIVTATGVERVADDFAWGKASTPTPVGRTFIMLTKVEPAFAYTDGHPLVYLGVQSPTLAGFDGGDVAVTAFHYYKNRSGPNSFGCIYLDGPSTDRLAELPAGTPVIIRP